MNRRGTIVGAFAIGAAAVLAASGSAGAQQPPKSRLPRIGVLSPASSESIPVLEALRKGLRDLGYVDGETISIEYRFAAGNFAALPALAAALASLPVDIIVTDGGDRVAEIAQRASRTIPIVMGTASDPVATGLARSLAQPGGNVTGLTLLSKELSAKRLQLLKEAAPRAVRMAALWDAASGDVPFRATEQAARELRIGLLPVPVSAPGELDAAVRQAALQGADAIAVVPSAMFWNERARIVAAIAEVRLPAIYPEREYAEAGGIIAYGPDVPDNFRRAASFVDRILKGMRPRDLPIEQPAIFEMTVNLKAALAIGIEIPQSIVLRADRVIE